MLVAFVMGLALLTTADTPTLDTKQMRELIREKQAPMRSLALVFEGSQRVVGDPKRLGTDPRIFLEDFQGALLLRGDDGLLDYYAVNPSMTKGVVREKYASLGGVGTNVTKLLDARRPLRPDRVVTFASRIDLRQMPLPTMVRPLFATWLLEQRCTTPGVTITDQWWEMVGDRNCLKVRTRYTYPEDRPRELRLEEVQDYWVDLDRNTQTLRMETFFEGKIIRRLDQIEVKEFPQPDGPSVWVPVHCRHQEYLVRSEPTAEPTLERIAAVVAGSVRVNAPLPDSAFSVREELSRPDSSTPDETRRADGAGGLSRRFRAQSPPKPSAAADFWRLWARLRGIWDQPKPPPAANPSATSPKHVRKRVAAHLDEANKQAEELQASSPARQAWSGTLVAQVVTGVLGAGLLVAVLASRLRRGA